ncbi:MAG: DJ-1/PfpI family protein [Theionarchaea archaeon]|nr:DJ-1/PfpI family protein [Theionarchaea archaeon]
MKRKIDFLVFPLVEELDVIGPFEVFGKVTDIGDDICELSILAPREVTTCRHGLNILRTLPLDAKNCGNILVIPGGKGAREPSEERKEVINFLRACHIKYELVVSVCTGTFLLDEAGILTNKVCTTHTLFQEELKSKGHSVVPFRVVHDGKLITSTGVTSGIDASLYVTALLYGNSTTEKIVNRIEYPFSVNQILAMVRVIKADPKTP